MPKPRRGYRCSACAHESAAYSGRCPSCNAWNTFEQFQLSSGPPIAGRAPSSRSAPAPAQTLTLASVPDEPGRRMATSIPEFDLVLGGGIVPGSLVLVGGEPGIGKSTLMLQTVARLATNGVRVGYVCGEESPRQVRVRASRLGIAGDDITLIPETNLEAALAAAEGHGLQVLIIDSIQSMYLEGLEARSGGPAQLAESGALLVRWAKANEIATIITGHVTKEGEIAGPRLLEHLVDAVLYFQSAESGALRVLRAVKNRFGATDEVGVFEMAGDGLRSIENPSAAFLETGAETASGCAITATIEGSRPIAVELQALAVPSHLASPRRIASGIETSRLHLLLAVLARRGNRNAAGLDVVASVSGGLRLRDSAADLAVLAALASAIDDLALPPRTAFLGEVALSGAVRPVQQVHRRLAELQRLGITDCVVPPGTADVPGIRLLPVSTVREALTAVLRPAAKARG